jgi:DNA invertase Pin-like site-specific DNA recombinase
MAPLKDETRAAIRSLFFVGHRSIREIARELRLSVRTVRRALVIDGDARPTPSHGPYGKEHDS